MQCECPERAPIPCDTSDLHAPCCAAQQLACVPGPKPRRETRDANAEEATGEKQLLRLERPFQTAGPTYNVIQNARGFLTKQVMRCRARLTAPLGRAQPPLSTTPYPTTRPNDSRSCAAPTGARTAQGPAGRAGATATSVASGEPGASSRLHGRRNHADVRAEAAARCESRPPRGPQASGGGASGL